MMASHLVRQTRGVFFFSSPSKYPFAVVCAAITREGEWPSWKHALACGVRRPDRKPAQVRVSTVYRALVAAGTLPEP